MSVSVKFEVVIILCSSFNITRSISFVLQILSPGRLLALFPCRSPYKAYRKYPLKMCTLQQLYINTGIIADSFIGYTGSEIIVVLIEPHNAMKMNTVTYSLTYRSAQQLGGACSWLRRANQHILRFTWWTQLGIPAPQNNRSLQS